jgi:hypothetical protein
MPLDSDPMIDWAKRADGEPHKLVRGKHYQRDAELVRKSAGMYATRHRLRCLTEIGTDGSSITVRFIPQREKV